ncbi:BRCA1-associated RING domain protein [Actinidia chinensis var. chinensis]|uniref:BRCA1-associated RING domain protein n=1 Tax=Actinidia chinensis var. chinensis TaxID=1590841 RepID=A0A2R6PEE7_ACTCC|nr:BRCA1-associated RING domain protein [Actinidia chinensis var. chinensis]
MADDPNHARFLNSSLLHHQKLGLELKCPLCLNLLNRPILLPCNHLFCDSCIQRSTQYVSECSLCKQQYAHRDVRPAPYIKNLVTIYRSLDATFSDVGRVQQQFPPLDTNVDNELKDSIQTAQEGNSSNGQPMFSSKRVQATLNQSGEDENDLTGKSDKSTPPITSMVEGFEMWDGDGMIFRGGGKSIPPQYPGCMKSAKYVVPFTEEIDTDRVVQSSPGSPPSFVIRGIDDDNSDPVSRNSSTEKHPSKRIVESNSAKAGGETNNTTSPGAGAGANHSRNTKRQKKLNSRLSATGMKSSGCTQPNVFPSENAATSELEYRLGEFSGIKANTISDSNDANRSTCAFCQSSELTFRTGPMLHFINGKEVKGDAATNSNIIHVHKTCIEWTPQVYFVGETVKNLKAEVARAARLKCSRCRLRGAALGCFEKSCHNSYHVPCAVEILGCRWDIEDFLMLCPNHSLVKFPREKSMLGKHAVEEQHTVPTEITSKQSTFWDASHNGVKEWIFCGSALSADEKYLLVKFASICGATVSKFWKPNVTHVIASTDAKGACCRTLKVLKAILNGRWILKTDWIKACMEALHSVDEEPYEVGLDNHGCRDGPKTGRLRALDNAPKLFNGLSFYVSGDFESAYKEDLLDLIITAGGIVIEDKEQLFAQSHDALATPSVTLVVYNNDCKLEIGGSIVSKRRVVAENLADEIGSEVIAHTWLLESIAACELQPLAC